MTTDEALAIVQDLAGGDAFHGDKLIFSERYALQKLLNEREATIRLAAKFRAREVGGYQRYAANMHTKSGLATVKHTPYIAATWAAAAEDLERVLKGVEDE